MSQLAFVFAEYGNTFLNAFLPWGQSSSHGQAQAASLKRYRNGRAFAFRGGRRLRFRRLLHGAADVKLLKTRTPFFGVPPPKPSERSSHGTKASLYLR